MFNIYVVSTHIYTWHTDKSAHTGSKDDKTHLVLHVPIRFRLEPRDSASKGRRVVERPFLFLSPLLSAGRDFSNVDAHFAGLVGTIILS